MRNNYPEIRLSGYDTEWSLKKLGDITDVKDSSRISNTLWISNGVPYLRSSDLSNDNIKGELFLSKRTYQEYSTKTGAPSRGDLLFTSGGKIGVTYYKEDDSDVYVQGGSILYAKTSESEHLDGRFLKSYFDTSILKKYIENASTGLTIKHFTLKPAKDTPITIPDLEEQIKIGLFFKKLDDVISLHQKELDAFKQTKKGFLHKMFPKDEETIPEIRFPEFKGDWKLTTLGEIAEIVRGASPRPIQNPKWFDDTSEVGWLRIADVTEQNGRIHRLEQRLSVDGQSKTRVLTKPHLMLSIAATVGKPVINYVSTGVHDGFLIFKNPQFDIEFMFQWLEMFRLKWSKYGQPGSQVNLNSELVRNQILYLPDIKEQIKISRFFEQIDQVISLKEKELEVLKKTRQGFLQKMFV
ncbi:restriction endonuclease subunit S [Exiguobacterium sp. KRL4]|uniref:restriction endonuclease subunit S n=1 Tax=Exiguobacterium sp. KRL4 TaxID=1914536 RepID=UPI000B1DE3BB|nr:restriction endonuclease subunit S [Exiguobacterium sp. KRL4]